MFDFKSINENKISFKINNNLFSERVIVKVLYWLQGSYIVEWNKNYEISEINLLKKCEYFTEDEKNSLHQRISRDLVDFKTREIIFEETKEIRNILLIKAFANNDDFEDYFLTKDYPN
jgi:His-Xaa-Ser system protein HxsD